MNWGNKLLITFVVFAVGMSYLVYRSLHTNFELVEKDYYKTELGYQQVIDATNRVNRLAESVKLEQTEKEIRLQLPSEMKHKIIKGEVWFYCAYNAGNDKKIALSLNEEASQVFSGSMIVQGKYIVKLKWTVDGHEYYTEKNLIVR